MRSAPVILALDASTDTLALALSQGADDTRCLETPGGAQASARMVPTALRLLADAGLCLADVDAIAFARGPGAFTGLRTACAVAQGLAFGANKPVLSIDSLMLVAEDAHRQGAPSTLWVAMDARMGEIYAAHYQADDQADDRGWRVLEAPRLYSPAALEAQWRAGAPPAAIAGSALAMLGPWNCPVVAQTRSRGEALAALARAAWARGETLDPAQALPEYVRDKVALTTAERASALAA